MTEIPLFYYPFESTKKINAINSRLGERKLQLEEDSDGVVEEVAVSEGGGSVDVVTG